MKPRNCDFVVLASAVAKAGQGHELESALRAAAAPTRAQRGCVDFLLIRCRDDPHTVIAVERWASQADHDAHLQGQHVKDLMQRLQTILAEAPAISACEILDCV